MASDDNQLPETKEDVQGQTTRAVTTDGGEDTHQDSTQSPNHGNWPMAMALPEVFPILGVKHMVLGTVFGSITTLIEFLCWRAYSNGVPSYMAWSRGLPMAILSYIPGFVSCYRTNITVIDPEAPVPTVQSLLPVAVFIGLCHMILYSFPPFLGIFPAQFIPVFVLYEVLQVVLSKRRNLPKKRIQEYFAGDNIISVAVLFGVTSVVWYPLACQYSSVEIAGVMLTSWFGMIDVAVIRICRRHFDKCAKKHPEHLIELTALFNFYVAAQVIYGEGFRFAALFVTAVQSPQLDSTYWSGLFFSFGSSLLVNLFSRTRMAAPALHMITNMDAFTPDCAMYILQRCKYFAGYPRFGMVAAVMLGRLLCGTAGPDDPAYFNANVVALLTVAGSFMMLEDLFMLAWDSMVPMTMGHKRFQKYYDDRNRERNSPMTRPFSTGEDGNLKFDIEFWVADAFAEDGINMWWQIAWHHMSTYQIITCRISFLYFIGLVGQSAEVVDDGSLLWPVTDFNL